MYPYMNNQMRSALNPGDANAQSTSPINAVVKTTALPSSGQNRRVTARSGARAATNNSVRPMSVPAGNAGVARSAVTGTQSQGRGISPRRVTARRTNTTVVGTITSPTSGVYVSSSRCLADYTDCMNSYCEHANTEYNRCFCSSKLSQIESTYQEQIDSLIKQIIVAKGESQWSDEEMAAYWYEKIGQYVGENTWEKLEDALNITWPDAETRMQGQSAYLSGHQYCVQNLKNCAYAVTNMRDVYRSEISRDCAMYEKSLDRLKTALETVLATYTDD